MSALALGNIMKIGQQPDFQPTGPQALAPASAKAGQAQVESAKGGAKAAPGVGVTVSELARTLEQTGVSSDAEVDVEKVNAMRQAIEQNSYRVNPEAIADKLLANAHEMLNRTLS